MEDLLANALNPLLKCRTNVFGQSTSTANEKSLWTNNLPGHRPFGYTPVFDSRPANPPVNPTNLAMTTSITSALCAHSSIAGPHLLPACSPLLQLAVRQALGACLPNFEHLSIQGEIQVSVCSRQNGQVATTSNTVLKFSDGAAEKNEHNEHNTNFHAYSEADNMRAMSSNLTSNGVGSAKRKASNPTKRECVNEMTTQSVSPQSSTSFGGATSSSAPTSPSADSGVLDLSRNGSLAGSAPMTPMKEPTNPLESGNILLRMYQNQLATLGQLQSVLTGNPQNLQESPVNIMNGFNFNATPVPSNESPINTTPRRARAANRGGQVRRVIPNRRFPCNQCNEEFPSLLTLEEHTMRLHGSYRCHICSAQFTQRSNLQRHALKHVGFKPFECRVCSKSYYRKDHLMRHMEMGHPGFSPREFITVHLTSSESLEFLNKSGLGQIRKSVAAVEREQNTLDRSENSRMEVDGDFESSQTHNELVACDESIGPVADTTTHDELSNDNFAEDTLTVQQADAEQSTLSPNFTAQNEAQPADRM